MLEAQRVGQVLVVCCDPEQGGGVEAAILTEMRGPSQGSITFETLDASLSHHYKGVKLTITRHSEHSYTGDHDVEFSLDIRAHPCWQYPKGNLGSVSCPCRQIPAHPSSQPCQP